MYQDFVRFRAEALKNLARFMIDSFQIFLTLVISKMLGLYLQGGILQSSQSMKVPTQKSNLYLFSVLQRKVHFTPLKTIHFICFMPYA